MSKHFPLLVTDKLNRLVVILGIKLSNDNTQELMLYMNVIQFL